MKTLVIDDEFTALTKMKAMLEKYGEVDPATCGEQAIALFEKSIAEANPYDLITIDIELPDMNGIELLKIFNQKESAWQTSWAKKVIISASGTPDNVVKSAKNACDAFLVKPIKKETLNEKLIALGLIEPEPKNDEATAPKS